MSELNYETLFDCLNKEDLSPLSKGFLSESLLKDLAELLILDGVSKYTSLFFEHIINCPFDVNIDWNIGSIIQHFDIKDIVAGLKEVPERKRFYLYESRGLLWALGEKSTKDQTVLDFLYDVVNYAKDSEAWWMAAFALEKLTGKNAINNLKRSMKGRKSVSLDDSLKNISDKRNVIAILLNATNIDIKNKIFPTLKELCLETTQKNVLLNTLWLIGHLRLFDNAIIEKLKEIIKVTKDDEIIYTVYTVASKEPRGSFEDLFLTGLENENPLIRKMALRGLAKINSRRNIGVIEDLLDREHNIQVISEAALTLSQIKNEQIRSERKILSRCRVNENGDYNRYKRNSEKGFETNGENR